jgi:hypothetical protein
METLLTESMISEFSSLASTGKLVQEAFFWKLSSRSFLLEAFSTAGEFPPKRYAAGS